MVVVTGAPMPARKRREPTAVDLPAAVLGRIVGSAVLAVGTIPAPRFVETHNSYVAQSSDTEYWQRIHDDAAGRQFPKDTLERRQGMLNARLDVVHAARCVRRRVAEGAEDGEAAARQVSVVTGLVLGRRAFVP